METFYFVLAFVIVLGFYAYSNLRLRKDYILTADSEPSKNLTPDEAKKLSYYRKHKIYKDTEGGTIDPKDMIHIFVSGSSLSPCNIESGDELIVMKTDDSIPLIKQIKENDILLLYLDDIHIHKLRRFSSFEGENLITYYYDSEGHQRMSPIPYKPESVLGVAKYKVRNAPSTSTRQKTHQINLNESDNVDPLPKQQSGQPKQLRHTAKQTPQVSSSQKRRHPRKRPPRKN